MSPFHCLCHPNGDDLFCFMRLTLFYWLCKVMLFIKLQKKTHKCSRVQLVLPLNANRYHIGRDVLTVVWALGWPWHTGPSGAPLCGPPPSNPPPMTIKFFFARTCFPHLSAALGSPTFSHPVPQVYLSSSSPLSLSVFDQAELWSMLGIWGLWTFGWVLVTLVVE